MRRLTSRVSGRVALSYSWELRCRAPLHAFVRPCAVLAAEPVLVKVTPCCAHQSSTFASADEDSAVDSEPSSVSYCLARRSGVLAGSERVGLTSRVSGRVVVDGT